MLTRLFLIIVGVLVAAPVHAFAYTDPGSGTLIWQMLLAASFGVMFYFRRIIGWVRGLKSRRKRAPSALASPADAETEIESESGNEKVHLTR